MGKKKGLKVKYIVAIVAGIVVLGAIGLVVAMKVNGLM